MDEQDTTPPIPDTDIDSSPTPTTEPGPGSVSIPSISPNIVSSLGIALILLSALSSGRAMRIWQLIYNGQAKDTNKNDLATIGGQLIFVLIFSFLSEVNGDMSNLVFSFFMALLLVWSMLNTKTLARWLQKITPPPTK